LTVVHTADLNGGNVTTSGAQTYEGPVVLTSDNLLTASTLTFASTVDGAHNLTAAAALTVLEDAVGSTTPLASLTALHTIDLNGGSVVTTGAQDYQGPVILTSDNGLSGSAITFQGAVDGAWGLTATGLTSFDGAVGNTTALASLAVHGTADLNGGSVKTTGAQDYEGPVVLTSDNLLTASTLTFASTLNGAFNLTSAAVLTILEGAAGATTPLAGLTVQQTVDLNGGSVKTTGAQDYEGPVILTSDNLLTASTLTLGSTVNGAFNLTSAAALTILEGAVGNTTALASLTVQQTADLNGGSVVTTGAQNYLGPVVLTTNDLLTGSAITFHGAVDGAWALTATGLTSFDGVVGGATPLASLAVHGTADLNGGIVNTTGAQDYFGPAVLTTDGLLAGSAITFHGTVDGGWSLTATGLTSFDGAVGGTTALTSLAVHGTADLNGGSVKTTGAQDYEGPVVLTSDNLLTATTLTFASTVNGAFGLTAAAAMTVFDGSIGGSTPLASLTVTQTADLNGGSVATSGAQTYQGPVVLTANDALTASSILFVSTVDGAFGLTATAAATTFDGSVGSGTALTSLTVAHTADLNGGSVTTSGAQTYNGPVVLTSDMVLTGSAVTFASALDAAAVGAEGLSIAVGGGAVLFEGNVGGTALSSLTVTAGGISFGATGGSLVHTTGSQSFTGPVVLLHDESMTSDAGSIFFVGTGSTINGAHALTLLASAGTVSLGGSAGNTTALTTLSVDPAAIVLGGSTYHTTGGQTYSEAVTLGSDAVITADSGGIVFTQTIDGAHSLSLIASAGTVSVGGTIGGGVALTGLSIAGSTGVTVTSITTQGTQRLSSGGTIRIGGVYVTGDGSFTAAGAVALANATTINPGAGSLTVTGPLTGTANLAVLGSGGASFTSINLGNTGTIDLSGKTAGSFTASGAVTAAGLLTGTNPYSLSLLAGGTIGDPTLQNSGGDTLAGSFLFSGGLSVPGPLTLAGDTTLNEQTGSIVLGTVQQGASTFVVIADQVTLNGKWTGTGARGLTPFSNLSIGLGDAAGAWTLNATALAMLAEPPLFAVIGGGTGITQEIQTVLSGQTLIVPAGAQGAVSLGTFTFNAPLIVIGSSITVTGTVSQTSGNLALVTPGAISGAGTLNLGSGTGNLDVLANSANLTGTVNGTGGSGAAQFTFLLEAPLAGPYLINGVCFAGATCGQSGPAPPPFIPGTNVIYTNNANGVQGNSGGLGAPPTNPSGPSGPGDIQPGSGDTSGSQTDVLVSDLSGPANSKPAQQAQPKVQGFYVSLLGNLLYEWRPAGNQSQDSGTPEQNSDYSNWGKEAGW
ncbi:MAG TPA: hypothetical protein VMG55_15590, partial [Stellaceae bacterium]|nr:hypothetical protein [Stellaceae bacterium]